MKASSFLPFFVSIFSACGQTALSPSAPALKEPPPTVFVPSSPALSVGPVGASNTNVLSAGSAAAELSMLLTNLQNDLAVTLPIVTGFNDGFDFAVTGANGPVVGVATVGNNSSSATGSVPIPSTAAVAGGSMRNGTGLPPGFAAFPITRDTVRALMILQSDFERILGLLNALNNGNNTTASGNRSVLGSAGGLTNSSPLIQR